ncbi:hypothetical protein GCM10012282_00130 [Streptomyces lacrimifluminis]|uniref:Uncharacterized protein n=1 Tax=Streptomyces lacrimifluminis TaxID=1500077 RepID=A0A917NLT8_9ACTN|nr:hypothetical protein GCM10012282_00130 [Streptomyces lacrimifluminis]
MPALQVTAEQGPHPGTPRHYPRSRGASDGPWGGVSMGRTGDGGDGKQRDNGKQACHRSTRGTSEALHQGPL